MWSLFWVFKPSKVSAFIFYFVPNCYMSLETQSKFLEIFRVRIKFPSLRTNSWTPVPLGSSVYQRHIHVHYNNLFRQCCMAYLRNMHRASTRLLMRVTVHDLRSQVESWPKRLLLLSSRPMGLRLHLYSKANSKLIFFLNFLKFNLFFTKSLKLSK